MAVGDTWIAKRVGALGNSTVVVFCYKPNGVLSDSFTVEEPADALVDNLCIAAANDIVVVGSGDYIYTRANSGVTSTYKYDTDGYPYRIKYSNGTFFFFTYFESGDNYGNKVFSSHNGTDWVLRHTGYETIEGEIPGAIYDIEYYSATGYYIVVGGTYTEIGYGTRLYRTTDFVSFETVGDTNTRTSWIYLVDTDGKISYLNWRPSSTPAWGVHAVCEMSETGIRTIPFTIQPADQTLSLPFFTQTLDVGIDNIPYIIATTTYTDFPNFYLWKRNEAETAYEKYGSAFLSTEISKLDRVSTYRAHTQEFGYVALEFYSTLEYSVRIVNENTSSFTIPLHNAENWDCCYLENQPYDEFWTEERLAIEQSYDY